MKKRSASSKNLTPAQVDALIYSTIMRIATAGAAVLQDTYGLTQEQAVEWWIETARRANPQNAGGKFVADKVRPNA